MKVKIFENTNYFELEKEMNDFLRDWEIRAIDVKYATVVLDCQIHYSAMVMYKIAE